ncbi:MAG: iron-sulfur cluster assembly protein, partial [Gammaproteobacteria bacterium]|nr:iron-sulfur cluster assembly protein [Gammaproteobacteria bacterium]
MSEISQVMVETALKNYIDPYLEKDLVSTKAIKSIAIEGGHITVSIQLGYPCAGMREEMAANIKKTLSSLKGAGEIKIDL